LACFVKYVQKNASVVRLKNRFEHDVAERISAARLQQEFYAAEAWGHDDADSVASGDSGRESYEKMYRDVMLNVEIPREGADPFIAELQVALSGISILKKSEQTVYTIMRIKRPADLLNTYAFDHADLDLSPLSPASPRFHDAYAYESRVETDLGDVAVELEVAETSNDDMEARPTTPSPEEPEILQSEAPPQFRQSMFSCACEPCETASGDPLLASAPPTMQETSVTSRGSLHRMLPVDSELAATTAKLDAANERIAAMERELAALRKFQPSDPSFLAN
jgi:hypothetical protein